MKKAMIVLTLALALFSCDFTPSPEYDPTGEEPPILIMNECFVPGDEKGEILFETNDTRYITPRGVTFWYVREGEEENFTSREVKLSKLSGDPTAGYGLVCCYRVDRDYGNTMLVILINTMQEYIVAEITETGFEELVPWRESPLLNSGYNRSNILRLEYRAESGDYCLFINGQEETVFRDDEAPFHTGGRAGYLSVISPGDNFPEIPVEIQFTEITESTTTPRGGGLLTASGGVPQEGLLRGATEKNPTGAKVDCQLMAGRLTGKAFTVATYTADGFFRY